MHGWKTNATEPAYCWPAGGVSHQGGPRLAPRASTLSRVSCPVNATKMGAIHTPLVFGRREFAAWFEPVEWHRNPATWDQDFGTMLFDLAFREDAQRQELTFHRHGPQGCELGKATPRPSPCPVGARDSPGAPGKVPGTLSKRRGSMLKELLEFRENKRIEMEI